MGGMQLVVHSECVLRVLEDVHGATLGACLGSNKVLAKVWERYYWVHCREDEDIRCRKRKICAVTRSPTTQLNTQEVVRHSMGIGSDRMKALYDARANHSLFDEGDLVWLHN